MKEEFVNQMSLKLCDEEAFSDNDIVLARKNMHTLVQMIAKDFWNDEKNEKKFCTSFYWKKYQGAKLLFYKIYQRWADEVPIFLS